MHVKDNVLNNREMKWNLVYHHDSPLLQLSKVKGKNQEN
jgi:hypothetical protein